MFPIEWPRRYSVDTSASTPRRRSPGVRYDRGLLALIGGPVGLLAMAAAGGVVGGVAGHYLGRPIRKGELKELGEQLTPDSSAFLLLLEDTETEGVVDSMAGYNANVVTLTVGSELSGQIASFTEGVVTDPEGNVVAGASVVAADAEGDVVAGAEVVAATIEDEGEGTADDDSASDLACLKNNWVGDGRSAVPSIASYCRRST